MRIKLPAARSLTSLVVAIVIVGLGHAWWRDARQAPRRPVGLVGAPGAPSTSRADLGVAAAELRERLRDEPASSGASVALAAVLLRQARVLGDAGLIVEAAEILAAARDRSPDDYAVRRMQAMVLLSQHRFREGIRAAEDVRRRDPTDAWNYGMLGDAHLELGDYPAAIEAYETMARLRPGAPAYARLAHVFELQGRVGRALEAMRMAAEATSAHDPEAQAWHSVQLGHLYFQLGQLEAAGREYRRALFTFAGYPYAQIGLARVAAARGALDEAVRLLERSERQAATPEILWQLGDLQAALGHPMEAERLYVEAEALERAGWEDEAPQPGALARALAERNRRVAVAVRLAERAAADRADIHTLDALAWAYFRAGRTAEALEAIARALRTGTRDRSILFHAAAIRQAAGDRADARRLIARSLDGHETFDLVNAPAARRLREELSAGRTAN